MIDKREEAISGRRCSECGKPAAARIIIYGREYYLCDEHLHHPAFVKAINSRNNLHEIEWPHGYGGDHKVAREFRQPWFATRRSAISRWEYDAIDDDGDIIVPSDPLGLFDKATAEAM